MIYDLTVGKVQREKLHVRRQGSVFPVPRTLGKVFFGTLSVIEDTGIQDKNKVLPLAQHGHVTIKASREHAHST